MKFTKATSKSTIPFGVYNIDANYIHNLKKDNPLIVDPDYSNRYCGPVYSATCERGDIAFFVPIDPSYETKECFGTTFCNGIYADIFDFTKMIPCVSDRILEPNKNEKLTSFCKNNRDELEYYAEFVMAAKQTHI